MRFSNSITGDVLELPPPDQIGASVVLLNGAVIERVMYGDERGGTVTLGDGRVFSPAEDFIPYLLSIIGDSTV